MFHIRSHYHDDLRVRACADDFNVAWDQAIAEYENNDAAYVEIVRGDEMIWSSDRGFID